MKVLVATDGSDAAVQGARRGLAVLRTGIEVTVAMVIAEQADPMDTATGFTGSLLNEDEVVREYDERVRLGERMLDRTITTLGAAGVFVGDVVEGRLLPSGVDAAEGIVAEAERIGADLIVVGSSGKGRLWRLFGGSVSARILHEAPCPVLVCPPAASDADPPPGGPAPGSAG